MNAGSRIIGIAAGATIGFLVGMLWSKKKSKEPKGKQATTITVTLPLWAQEEVKKLPPTITSLDERMQLVNRLARLNFENKTGGPFAAAVFERETGKLVAVGVNRVVASPCSSAHAEVVALSLAQRSLGHYDLGGESMASHQLVVNWRPCAMCFGAVMWSGVQSVALAGSGPEMEQITGFDEGPIHPEWEQEFQRKGIEFINNCAKPAALEVFRAFAAQGQLVYNGRQGSRRQLPKEEHKTTQ